MNLPWLGLSILSLAVFGTFGCIWSKLLVSHTRSSSSALLPRPPKKGTLILTSLLEDLAQKVVRVRCIARLP